MSTGAGAPHLLAGGGPPGALRWHSFRRGPSGTRLGMAGRWLQFSRSAQAAFVAAGLVLPTAGWAEAGIGSTSASARVTLRVVVPPVLRILDVRPVPGGH